MAYSGSDLDLLETPWRTLMFIGAAAIALGALMVAASPIATLAMVWVIGCLMFAGGVVHLFQVFSARGWGRLGHAIMAALYCLVGARVIQSPVVAALSLTALAGALLVVGGVIRIGTALSHRSRSRGWLVFGGALSIVLGVAVLASWPSSGLWVIGMFVGVDLMLHGWSTVLLASVARAAVAPIIEPARALREHEREMAMRH